MTYYTLLVRDADYPARTDGWAVEFGDYDRETVEAERDNICEGYRSVRRKDTAIIASRDTQEAIEAAIAAFVAKQRSK